MLKRLRLTLDMIKFEHSVFALPFALTGALLAFRDGGYAAGAIWTKLLWIVVAMVGARSAAMAFNRLVDSDIDGRNPRTRMRHLPAGLLSRGFAWAFVAATSCQDYEFDCAEGLASVPRMLGIPRALRVAQAMHVLMVICLLALVYTLHLGGLAVAGVVAVTALLVYEHSLVEPNDLSRVNAAFFTMNGYVSVLFFVFWAADIFLLKPGA